MQGDREPRWWVRPALVGVGVVGLLILVAAVMPKVFAFRRGSGSADPVIPDNPLITDYLLIAVFLLLVVAAIMVRLIVQKGAPAGPPKRRPIWAQILTYAIIVFFVVTVSSVLEERGVLDPPDPAPTSVSEGASGSEPERSRPLGLLLTGVLVFLVAGLVVTIVMIGRRDEGRGRAAFSRRRPGGRARRRACRARHDRRAPRRGDRLLHADGTRFDRCGGPSSAVGRPFRVHRASARPRRRAPRERPKTDRLVREGSLQPPSDQLEMKDEAMATLEEVRAEIRGVTWQA